MRSPYILLVISLHACVGSDAREGINTNEHVELGRVGTTAVAPSDSIRFLAEQTIATYLNASLEASPNADALDSLTLCGDDLVVSYFPTTVLATWMIEGFEMRGDTVVVRASVTTVAEQDVNRRGGGFVARQRIQTDALEWDVYRNDDNRWVVCNGLSFGYKGADSLTVWRPDGASYESVKALADSFAQR